MLKRIFLSHPVAIGETYAEHATTAGRFGVAMVAGGAACIVHAVVPAVFEKTASDTVKRLYAQMKARQPAYAQKRAAFEEPDWRPEYEI